MGIRGVRHQRLDPRDQGCGGVLAGRSRRGDALPDDPGHRAPARARRGRGDLGTGRPARPSGSLPPGSGSTASSDPPAPSREILAGPSHRALAREVSARSVVLLRNEPVDGRPILPLELAPGQTVALLGRLAGTINLGDGGSSDVWAPEVVTASEGLRAALPDATIVEPDPDDTRAVATAAKEATVALVVVGYTRLDEGEYIGEFATAHLQHLFPGPDDPELVGRFEASIAGERSIEPPSYRRAETAGGFATGGDRRSLRLHEEDVALIRAVRGRQSEDDRGHRGRERGAHLRMGCGRAGRGPVVVRGHGGWQRPGRRPAGRSRCIGPAPVLRAGGRVPSAGLRPGRRVVHLRPVARLLAPGPNRRRGRLPLRVRDELHHVRGGRRRGRPVRRRPTRPGDRSEHRRAPRQRGGAGLRAPGRVARARTAPGVRAGRARARCRGRGRPRDADAATLAERDTSAHAMVVRAGTYEVRVARHAGDPGTTISVALPE